MTDPNVLLALEQILAVLAEVNARLLALETRQRPDEYQVVRSNGAEHG
jgi:hypothetical protein